MIPLKNCIYIYIYIYTRDRPVPIQGQRWDDNDSGVASQFGGLCQQVATSKWTQPFRRTELGATMTTEWHCSSMDFVSKSRHHSGLRRSVAQQVDYEVIQVVKVANVSTVSRQQAVYSIKAARQQGSRAAVRGRRSRSIAQAARPQGRRAAGRQRQAGSRAARLQGQQRSRGSRAAGQQGSRQQACRRAGRRSGRMHF